MQRDRNWMNNIFVYVINKNYNEEVECNIDEVGTWDSDDEDEEKSSLFEIVQVDAEQREKLNEINNYIRKWVKETNLCILQQKQHNARTSQ